MLKTALKFGMFLVICIFFTGYLALTIGNKKLRDIVPFSHHDTTTLSATFDDVTGLLINDNVKVAGVVVGKVTSIKVVDGRANVKFTVDGAYDLPSDSEAAIRWRNLIGQRYVYLYPGSASTMLEDGDAITDTRSVVDLGELFNRLGPIIAAIDPAEVNTFLDTITQALDGNQDKVGQAIDDLSVLAKGLGDRDATIGHLVENLNTVAGTLANRDAQIRTMLDNLVLISQTFSDNTAVVDDALTELSSFSGSLSSLLNDNAGQLDRMIANLDLIVQTVGSKLEPLDHALAGMQTTADRIFRSSSLGEWLNETILCDGLGPPTGTTCQDTILKGPPGQQTSPAPPAASAGGPGVAVPSVPPITADPTTGVDAITGLVTGGPS
jgi:phospholipid/cholesterol/gamma-HCH transport system substrate-binding protein